VVTAACPFSFTSFFLLFFRFATSGHHTRSQQIRLLSFPSLFFGTPLVNVSFFPPKIHHSCGPRLVPSFPPVCCFPRASCRPPKQKSTSRLDYPPPDRAETFQGIVVFDPIKTPQNGSQTYTDFASALAIPSSTILVFLWFFFLGFLFFFFFFFFLSLFFFLTKS